MSDSKTPLAVRLARVARRWIAHSLFWFRHEFWEDCDNCSRCGKTLEEPKP